MKRNLQHMPYGYEPPKESVKGTLIFYDTFEHTTEQELDKAYQVMKQSSFSRLVLYPLHEETVKRMTKEQAIPFYKREKALMEWIQETAGNQVVVEAWEGKRKKYTPIEAALRHLTEKYPGPHFLYLTPDLANAFASYSSFEEWITKIRLILSSEPALLHPRLTKFHSRWSTAE